MTKTPPPGPRGIIPEANYQPARATPRPAPDAGAIRHVTIDERGEAKPVPRDVAALFRLTNKAIINDQVGTLADIAAPMMRGAREKGQPEAPEPVTYYDPTEEDRADFLAKVLPILDEACEEMGLPLTDHLMNLLCVFEPESVEEADFQDEVLRRIWAKYPGAAYPVMCWPAPAAVAPAVAVH